MGDEGSEKNEPFRTTLKKIKISAANGEWCYVENDVSKEWPFTNTNDE